MKLDYGEHILFKNHTQELISKINIYIVVNKTIFGAAENTLKLQTGLNRVIL